jgi:O-antigen ligase
MLSFYVLLFFERFHAYARLGGVLFQAGFVPVSLVKIVGIVAMVAAIVRRPTEQDVPRVSNRLPLLFAGIAIVPVMAFAIMNLSWRQESVSEPLASLVSLAMFLPVVRLTLRSERDLYNSMRALVVVETISSLWLSKEHFIDHAERVAGLELNANYEAIVLLIAIPAAICVFRNEKKLLARGLALASIPILCYSVVLTQSRGGLLGCGVMAMCGFIRSHRKALVLFGSALVLMLLIVVAPSGLSTRFRSLGFLAAPVDLHRAAAYTGDDLSTAVHYYILVVGVHMVMDNPLFGVGLGQFIPQEDRYDRNLIDLAGKPFIAHNTYIQIGAEQGLIVLALFMGMLVLAIRNCRFVERTNPGPRVVSIAVAVRIGLQGFSVAAFFVSAPYMVFYWMLVFISQNLREVAIARMPIEKKYAVQQRLVRNAVAAASA